ncbi:serine/threonine-protein kinase [Sorangium sp. So ce295]|jgi:serine/threonine-protein kinase|uniref:serine/threonine-protein kinase n=1 Tax=Sorangium sp. So ce295 TaxID=3133295 RepID=UPI003F619963
MNPGQQVTSTLRLARELGKGAMGSVWVADHLALGTQVAVKFMAPAYADQTGFVERFRREAMAAAQIKSPHVAQVFDHGVTPDGVPFIVMELLEGEDLKSRMQRLGALPPVEVTTIVSQTAKALGRAHQVGIVHRDIKPDNIFLLDVEGELFVKVLDFGVAKRVQGELGMTSTGSVLGTPLYMSPEQLLSAKHVDFRADLWGLAVVAYHALTEQVPFRGETLGALSVVLHTGIFTPPSEVRPELSPAIDAWMKKALAHDPAARFSSARQMAEALERAVLGIARTAFTTEPSSAGERPLHGSASQPVLFGEPTPLPPAPGARLSTTGTPPSSAPGARLSTDGAPGRTLAGMATSGTDGARRWAPAILAAALAFGALVAAVVFLATKQSPTAEVTPSSEAPARQAAPVPAQPVVPAPPSAAAPVPAEPASATPAAETAQPAATAATAQPAATAATAQPAGAARTGAAARPGATAAPRGTSEGRGRPTPREASTGRPTGTKPPAPVEDTIGF